MGSGGAFPGVSSARFFRLLPTPRAAAAGRGAMTGKISLARGSEATGGRLPLAPGPRGAGLPGPGTEGAGTQQNRRRLPFFWEIS